MPKEAAKAKCHLFSPFQCVMRHVAFATQNNEIRGVIVWPFCDVGATVIPMMTFQAVSAVANSAALTWYFWALAQASAVMTRIARSTALRTPIRPMAEMVHGNRPSYPAKDSMVSPSVAPATHGSKKEMASSRSSGNARAAACATLRPIGLIPTLVSVHVERGKSNRRANWRSVKLITVCFSISRRKSITSLPAVTSVTGAVAAVKSHLAENERPWQMLREC